MFFQIDMKNYNVIYFLCRYSLLINLCVYWPDAL